MIPGTGMQVFRFWGMPRLALGPAQSHIQWIAQAKWSGHEAANSPSLVSARESLFSHMPLWQA